MFKTTRRVGRFWNRFPILSPARLTGLRGMKVCFAIFSSGCRIFVPLVEKASRSCTQLFRACFQLYWRGWFGW